jgi:hypothetical protein
MFYMRFNNSGRVWFDSTISRLSLIGLERKEVLVEAVRVKSELLKDISYCVPILVWKT